MDEKPFNSIVSLSESENVKRGLGYSDLIGERFFLGQSRYACRWGTLSDGHEKITNSQRYKQALKEAHGLAKNIKLNKVQAMKAEADRLEAVEKLRVLPENASPAQLLRANAEIEEATEKLNSALDTIKDQMRMLDEYEKIRQELEPEFLAKYKNAEESEADDWKATAEYRIKMGRPNRDLFPHYIPLDPFTKAELGVETNSKDLTAWLEVSEKKAIQDIAGGDLVKALEMRRQYVKSIDQKKAE